MGDGVQESQTELNMRSMERQALVGMVKEDHGLMMYMKLVVRIITNYLPLSGKIRRSSLKFSDWSTKIAFICIYAAFNLPVKLALNCLQLPLSDSGAESTKGLKPKNYLYFECFCSLKVLKKTKCWNS